MDNQLVCPKCKTEYEEGAKFCSECGKKLPKPKPPKPALVVIESNGNAQLTGQYQQKLAFSVKEAAEVTSLGVHTVYELIQQHKVTQFPFVKIGRRIVIPRLALEEWLNKQKEVLLAQEG